MVTQLVDHPVPIDFVFRSMVQNVQSDEADKQSSNFIVEFIHSATSRSTILKTDRVAKLIQVQRTTHLALLPIRPRIRSGGMSHHLREGPRGAVEVRRSSTTGTSRGLFGRTGLIAVNFNSRPPNLNIKGGNARNHPGAKPLVPRIGLLVHC